MSGPVANDTLPGNLSAPNGFSQEAYNSLITRLSSVPDLQLPSRLQGEAPRSTAVLDHLSDLLAREPGVFLERYGSRLVSGELRLFEQLRGGNYEVDYYCTQLHASAAAAAASPSTTAGGQLAAVVKNRRLAFMQRLESSSDYFSEEEMRERAPQLWHNHVGRHVGMQPPPAARQGDSMADHLLRTHDEALLCQRLQQASDEERAQLSEHESEEEGGADEAAPAASGVDWGGAGGSGRGPGSTARGSGVAGAEAGGGHGGLTGGGGERLNEADEEAAERGRAALLQEMRSRFLLGQDEGVDYAAMDADAQLDEHWAAQQAQDAEDAYFADD